MVIKARLILALVFLVLSVLVDFTSTILSVLSDGALVAVAVTLVWPIFKPASEGSVMSFWDFADKYPIVLIIIVAIVVGGIVSAIEALRKQ